MSMFDSSSPRMSAAKASAFSVATAASSRAMVWTRSSIILETGNDSFRFKASTAAATRKKTEALPKLTPA
jgi:hypothetical protein